MSERMSSVEIEDVLSSIRRLVSEDLRPMQRPKARLDAGSKLILTPALRVVPNAEGSGAEPTASPEFDQNEADFLTENDADQAGFDAVELSSPLQTLLDDIAHGEGRSSDHAAHLPDPADASVATPASIEAVVSALGAAVTGQGWEGEQENAPEPAVDWTDQVWAERTLADVATTGPDRVVDAELIESADVADAPLAMDEIWVQSPEPFVVETSFREDDEDELPFSESEIADLAEAAAVAEILSAGSAIIDETAQVVQDQPADAAEQSIFHDDAAFMDEDALRDMVRDILRQELQGDLGERITRNVRKLVRAEINRVMTSRDFE